MNDLQIAKDKYGLTDREIAELIREATGLDYHPRSITNARHSHSQNPDEGLTRPLQLAVRITFPDLHETGETA